MVRAPCCEKMGLKKGPWSPEEDRILISYIQSNGHSNWRALPKQAGLLRCGKSCRLRWINYLRPDIKRGNFTPEEEETIIKSHEMLGNRWSAIAARLPGRTDNEIKNVWHTHLKKRLKQNHAPLTKPNGRFESDEMAKPGLSNSDPPSMLSESLEGSADVRTSAQPCSSEVSSATDASTGPDEANKVIAVKSENMDYMFESFPLIDESFWSTDNSVDDYSSKFSEPPAPLDGDAQLQWLTGFNVEELAGNGLIADNGMDFWFDVFYRAESALELTQYF